MRDVFLTKQPISQNTQVLLVLYPSLSSHIYSFSHIYPFGFHGKVRCTHTAFWLTTHGIIIWQFSGLRVEKHNLLQSPEMHWVRLKRQKKLWNKNHGGLSSATDISSLLYSWKLLLLFSPLHVKTSGGELLQCICSEMRLEALHDLSRSGGCLVITGFTILPVTTFCIYLSRSSDKATDGINIKAVLLNIPCTF